MNGKQRIEAALRGDWPDQVPVMLHNFLMAAREAGVTQREYRENPAVIARTFIHSVEKYGYDGILVDVDTCTLAGAVGVPVDFPDDEPARCEAGCLTDLSTVKDLRVPDLSKDVRIQRWLEGVRLIKKHFGDAIYLRGNCDQSPFSLASMMRTPAEWMMDLMDEDQHENVHRLLDYCSAVTCQFLRLMATTGADMLSNGDSPAGPDMISPAMYRKFALAWEKKVVDQSHALGKPYMLHICGNTTGILEDMIATGSDAIELDYKTDVRVAHAATKDRVTFVGNIDPSGVLALGTVAQVEKKTRELLEIFADTPRFILNAGCAIPSTTPSANLAAMIRIARSFR